MRLVLFVEDFQREVLAGGEASVLQGHSQDAPRDAIVIANHEFPQSEFGAPFDTVKQILDGY